MEPTKLTPEELEQEAPEAQELENQQETQAAPYVERPKSQRVLAWVLLVLVVLGVLLYYGWIAGILH